MPRTPEEIAKLSKDQDAAVADNAKLAHAAGIQAAEVGKIIAEADKLKKVLGSSSD